MPVVMLVKTRGVSDLLSNQTAKITREILGLEVHSTVCHSRKLLTSWKDDCVAPGC